MPNYQKHIVYLSDEQRQELFTNGSITVNGQTVTYSDNDMYVTPQEAPVTDVQVDGTSVVTDGVANVPISASGQLGVIKPSWGTQVSAEGLLSLTFANSVHIKAGTDTARPVAAGHMSGATFYGLAKAAGDTTQSASSNAVGNYTETAKSAIKSMLGVGEWVNISDITLTEEMNSVTITTDRKYYEVYAYIDIKAGTDATSLAFGAKNEAGNYICIRYFAQQVNTTEKITFLRFESMPGMSVISYNTDNSSSQMRSFVNMNESTDNGIKTIVISAYGGQIMLPVGSVIKVYAR